MGPELSSSVILAQHGLAPRMLARGLAQEKNEYGDILSEWQAWIVEPAMSLRQKIQDTRLPEADAMR